MNSFNNHANANANAIIVYKDPAVAHPVHNTPNISAGDAVVELAVELAGRSIVVDPDPPARTDWAAMVLAVVELDHYNIAAEVELADRHSTAAVGLDSYHRPSAQHTELGWVHHTTAGVHVAAAEQSQLEPSGLKHHLSYFAFPALEPQLHQSVQLTGPASDYEPEQTPKASQSFWPHALVHEPTISHCSRLGAVASLWENCFLTVV